MRLIIMKIFKRLNSYKKYMIYKLIFGKNLKVGKKTFFYPSCRIHLGPQGRINIGKNCFFNYNCSLNSAGTINIGDDCIFGENVCMYDHDHNFRDSETLIRKQGYKIKKINIGKNCWIGSNCTILSGVNIGNNVVIGAGTIIKQDIPDNSIVVSDNKLRFLNK